MMRVLTVCAVIFLSLAAGSWLGSRLDYPVQAQTSLYLSSTPIPSSLTTTQIWMAEPFCVQAFWGPLLCSEVKGDEHRIGAPYKLDFLPAWLALEGRDTQGRWTLHSIAKSNDQSPGANFVAVTGPTLVTVLVSVTPSPVLPPPASVTTSPPYGATATPTARVTPPASTVTPTSPSPPGGGIPTLSPAQRSAFTIYCDRTGRPYGMTVWGSYGLTYSVPDEWCVPSRKASEELLERMRRATPAWVEVRP